eukprot:6410935-Amphidinium_carterae.2
MQQLQATRRSTRGRPHIRHASTWHVHFGVANTLAPKPTVQVSTQRHKAREENEGKEALKEQLDNKRTHFRGCCE